MKNIRRTSDADFLGQEGCKKNRLENGDGEKKFGVTTGDFASTTGKEKLAREGAVKSDRITLRTALQS